MIFLIKYLKTNWKSILLLLIIAGVILFNVKSYQRSQVIVRENQKINLQYEALAERETIYNQQISEYKSQISKKEFDIILEKNRLEKTEAQLQMSQDETRNISRRILSKSTDNPENLKQYVKACDSLATVAPLLADKVDTLKKQNKYLVKTMDEKSVLQDSIISKKDIIIVENKFLLSNTIKDYNKATVQLVLTEEKYNREKRRRGFWQKTAVTLALGLVGVLSVK